MVEKRSVSKLYRKLITSNEFKAFLVFENCDDELKEEVKQKLETSNSLYAKQILSKIQNI